MPGLFTRFKEPVSGFTHFFGAILGAAGAVFLLIPAFQHKSTLNFVAFAIYGASLVLLYSASAAYHLLRTSEGGTRLLRRLDHTMIYILIAGTYTPVCLIALRGTWGWGLLAVVWGLAFAGFLVSMFYTHKPRWLTVGIYIVMGWAVVVAFGPLLQRVPPAGIFWAIVGGLTYTVGAVIYALKRPNPWPGIFGFHEVWHLFVLLGGLAFFIMMYTTIQYL